jgi:hypothetical protein
MCGHGDIRAVLSDHAEMQAAFERWLPTPEHALIDPLSGLIELCIWQGRMSNLISWTHCRHD